MHARSSATPRRAVAVLALARLCATLPASALTGGPRHCDSETRDSAGSIISLLEIMRGSVGFDVIATLALLREDV